MPQKKLKDILNEFTASNSNPSDSYSKLCVLHSNCHYYLDQWSKLGNETKLASDVIKIVCRLEAGYQLCGFGVWVLIQLFTACPGESIANLFITDEVIEDMLRIGLEHPLHDKCCLLLYQMCRRKLIKFKKVYDTVINIIDQLPIPIGATNFLDLLKFCRQGMVLEPASQVNALSMLSSIVKNVEINYKVEFFIPDICQQLSPFLSDSCRDEELTRYSASLLQGITLLNTSHPRQLWQTGTLHKLVMLLLDSDSYKPATVAAIMDTLTAVSHDPLIRGHVSKRISPLVLASKLEREDLNCLESASRLFSKLYLQAKFQSALPLSSTVVNSVISRTSRRASRNEDTLLTVFSGGGLTGEQGESNYCCGFIIPALSQCLEVLSQEYDRNSLRKSRRASLRQSKGPDYSNASSDVPKFRDPVIVVSRVVQLLSRYQSFSAYQALTGILYRGRELLFPLMKDIFSFSLERTVIVDVFLAFGGHQELCWLHTVVETDKELVESGSKVPHTYPMEPPPRGPTSQSATPRTDVTITPRSKGVAGNGRASIVAATAKGNHMPGTNGALASSPTYVNGEASLTSPNKNLQQASINFDSDVSPEWMLFELNKRESKDSTPNDSAKILGIKLFLQHKNALATFLDNWEVKPVEILSRHILLFLVIAKTAGVYMCDGVVNLATLVEMILELLRDERLGLSNLPGMAEKCLQALACIGYEAALLQDRTDRRSFVSGYSFLTTAVSICDYALKNLISTENFQDPNLMFAYLSVLIATSSHDRLCRRKIVSNFSNIADAFMVCDQSSTVAPLLRLTLHVTDSIGKVDRDGEEALMSLVVRGLRMLFAGGYDIGVLAVSVIAEAGMINQNLAHRLFMRREVEDILAMLVNQGGIKSRLLADSSGGASESIEELDFEDLSSISMTLEEQCMKASLSRLRYNKGTNMIRREVEDPQMVLLLRACVVCVRELNPKPFWMYCSWSYGWWMYQAGLAHRPLLLQQTIESLAGMARTADSANKVLTLALVLSYSSSMMYNCLPGLPGRQPALSSDPALQRQVRDSLCTFILPLVPNALAIIGDDENHKSIPARSAQWLTSESSTKVFWTDPANYVYNNGQSKAASSTTVTTSAKTLGNGSRRGNLTDTPPVNDSVHPSPTMSSRAMRRQQEADASVLSQFREKVSDVSSGTTVDEPNMAMELLTDKTADAVIAFLCLPENAKMSAYTVNKKLFDKNPVITSIAYAMKCYPENSGIQKRGLEIIKTFLQNDQEIQTLCYYAPGILMLALNPHDETTEVHFTFATIVSKLSDVNETTRNHLILFSVHRGLAAIIRRKNLETTILCLVALRRLAFNSEVAAEIVKERSNVLSAVVFALDMFAHEIRVLMEGLQCLLCFKGTDEYRRLMGTRGGEGSLKKSRRMLTHMVREEGRTEPYTEVEVEAVLKASYIFKASDCVIL